MTLRSSPVFVCLMAGIAILCISESVAAQTVATNQNPGREMVARVDEAELPDAPEPQQTQAPATTPPAPSAAPASSQQPASGTAGQTSEADEKAQREKTAEGQIQQQQKQRVLGVLPNFNTSYLYGAASLTAGQKFRLALRAATDPVQFVFVTPFVALIGQAEGSHYGYGGGWGGYAKRYGQTYADSFDGAMLGNAVLPSILHQDPRYFRLGRGTIKRRVLYALGTNVITRHDVTGKWEPNYSNVIGNLAAGGISNFYLPKNERGFASTVTGGFTVTAEGGLGSMFQEFWPDISRHFLHKDPTGGQDAINALKPDPSGGGNPFSNHRDKQ